MAEAKGGQRAADKLLPHPVIRSLAGPLEVEASKGYPDAAVIGQSIGEYARGWAKRAKGVLGGSEEHRMAEQIARALADYRECDAGGRRKRVEKARALLRRLGADSEHAHASPIGGRKAGGAASHGRSTERSQAAGMPFDSAQGKLRHPRPTSASPG